MAGKKEMKYYPLELKLEAMRMFYEEGRTQKPGGTSPRSVRPRTGQYSTCKITTKKTRCSLEHLVLVVNELLR